MSGFAARVGLSAGVNDPLSVRALVVEDTAVVTVDVVGLHEDFCTSVKVRVRQCISHVVVHATHTHSGPGSIPGRLGTVFDAQWLKRVEDDCVAAVEEAARSRTPVRITAGYGKSPGIGRNRRHQDGPTDQALPVVSLERIDGRRLATLVSYACHPVVLSAENNLLSADFPGAVRARMEAAMGGIVLFATSCAGDVNTGHAIDGSGDGPGAAPRTIAQCELVGSIIADAASEANLKSGPQGTGWADNRVTVDLDLAMSTAQHPATTECDVSTNRESIREPGSDVIEANLHPDPTFDLEAGWEAPISVLRWGPAMIIALPGEPFCWASMEIRRHAELLTDAEVVAVVGYSDGCPGYFPTCDEYAYGGYEVEEAFHYYGMPGAFAQGSLERLVEESVRQIGRLRAATTKGSG